MFFWRSKENIDVAFHYNKDEGLVTISTRSHERGHNYPAIFVDASKIPVSKADAVSAAFFVYISICLLQRYDVRRTVRETKL